MDKFNVIMKRNTTLGVEHFETEEWRCTSNQYTYVNKYAKNSRITHKLNIIPF